MCGITRRQQPIAGHTAELCIMESASRLAARVVICKFACSATRQWWPEARAFNGQSGVDGTDLFRDRHCRCIAHELGFRLARLNYQLVLARNLACFILLEQSCFSFSFFSFSKCVGIDHLRVSGVSFLVYGARCLEVLGDLFVCLFCFVWTFTVGFVVS